MQSGKLMNGMSGHDFNKLESKWSSIKHSKKKRLLKTLIKVK